MRLRMQRSALLAAGGSTTGRATMDISMEFLQKSWKYIYHMI